MAITQAPAGGGPLSAPGFRWFDGGMPPGLRIRLAHEADALAIGVLVRRGTRQDVLRDQSARAGADLLAGMTARAERERIRDGKRYHVAELGGRIVGVVATRDDKHVFRLFVMKRLQRRGIAGALLRRAIADCRRRAGTRTFTLNASACAVPAYLRFGFRITGRAAPAGPGGIVATPMRYRTPAGEAAAPKAGRRRRTA
jgi:GNAT superfamily N-acetyltransferase